MHTESLSKLPKQAYYRGGRAATARSLPTDGDNFDYVRHGPAQPDRTLTKRLYILKGAAYTDGVLMKL